MKVSSFLYQSIIRVYKKLPFKKQFCLWLRATHFPIEKFYRDLKFDDWFRVKTSNSSFEIFHCGSSVENELFWKGISGYDATSLKTWSILARHSKRIIDVGANTGLYSLVAASENPMATIVALEPVEVNYRYLQNNIRRNSFQHIHPIQCAASDRNGTATFYDTTGFTRTSSSLEVEMAAQIKAGNQYQVATKTLDSILDDLKIDVVDLIKIDVELHEPHVLKGFERSLLRFEPAFIIEILKDAIGEQVSHFLPPDRYLYFNINEQAGLAETTELKAGGHFNFLILPRSRPELLKLIEPCLAGA